MVVRQQARAELARQRDVARVGGRDLSGGRHGRRLSLVPLRRCSTLSSRPSAQGTAVEGPDEEGEVVVFDSNVMSTGKMAGNHCYSWVRNERAMGCGVTELCCCRA